MKDTIFYFTGTGNSLAVAKKLAAQAGYELAPMAALRDAEEVRIDCGRVGLVFPLYYTGLPLIVKRFIQKLEFQNKPYIFAVVTCGDTQYSYALHGMRSELKQKGQRLSAGFTVPMVDNYLPIYKMPRPDELETVNRGVDEKAHAIAEVIHRGEEKMEREGKWIFHAIYPRFALVAPKLDRKFTVGEACNGCGTCEKVCPVENIQIKDGKPSYLHHCEFCLACIHHCPKTAIEWKDKTRGKGRYRYPEVTLKEIMGQKTMITSE